jgi:predicted enzyme related to lactoylglutathione lyase
MAPKLIIFTMPSAQPFASQGFYQQLFELDFARSLSDARAWHVPVSSDGIDLMIEEGHPGETPMAHFAVDDLNATLQQAQQLGGTVVFGPQDLPIAESVVANYQQLYRQLGGAGDASSTAGQAAVIRDPQGGLVGLVQLAPHTHEHFQYGQFRRPLTQKQQQAQDADKRIGANLPH